MSATLGALFLSAKRLRRKQNIWDTDTGIHGTDYLDKITPFRGTKTVIFSFTVPGLTEYVVDKYSNRKIGPVPHKEIFAFQDCNFLEPNQEPENKSNYFKIDYNGDTYWVEKIDVAKQRCTVRCNCTDFFMSWAYPDYLTGNLYGPPPKKYIRKTPLPPKGRPRRNPSNYPGFCKHIYYLWRNFFLRNAKDIYTK